MSDLDQTTTDEETTAQEGSPASPATYFIRQVQFPLKCPNGGLFTPDGERHAELELAPTTGEEEDILLNENLSESGDQIRRVLANCLLRIGNFKLPAYADRNKKDKAQALELVDKLTLNDATFALIMLRRISLFEGDIYKFEHKCSQCGKNEPPFIAVANLADLEVRPFDNDGKPASFKLPQSGHVVRFRQILFGESNRLKEMVTKYADSLPSMGLFLRIVDIDGEPPVSYRDLKQLSTYDREALRQYMEANEGGLDLTLNITCPKGHATTRMLTPTTSFFLPSFGNTKSPSRTATP